MATLYGADRLQTPPLSPRHTMLIAVALALAVHLCVLLGVDLPLPGLQVPREIPFDVVPVRMLAPQGGSDAAAHAAPRRSSHRARKAPPVLDAAADHVAVAAPAPVDAVPAVPDPTPDDPAHATVAHDVPPPPPEEAPAPVAPQPSKPWVIPPDVRLKYNVKGEIKGIPYFVFGELVWRHQDARYTASMEISHFILGARMQSSQGVLTDGGMRPQRFGDKVHSEATAHIDTDAGKARFSDASPDVDLEPGAQDQLSVYFQLALLLATDPERFAQGETVAFQTIGAHAAEHWIFRVGTMEPLSLPAGELHGMHLTGASQESPETAVDVWFSPEIAFLPAKIRFSQSNGDFVEQLLRKRLEP